MLLEKVTKKIFPEKLYTRIKYNYRKWKKQLFPAVNEEKFRNILRKELNVKKGSVVFIHSSFNGLNFTFSAQRLLEILIEEVGDEGTLLFPCNQLNIRAEEYIKSGGVFNVKRSPTLMGILPELARRRKNSYRSLHPTASVVGIGKLSKELLKEHHESKLPFGKKSPYYKITEHKGIIIGLGLETGQSLTFVHCVEDVMGEKFPFKIKMDETLIAKTIDYEGNTLDIETYVLHKNTSYQTISNFMKKYIPKNIGRDMKINGAKYYTVDSAALMDKMFELANKNITVYTEKSKGKA